jgi:hypothetical protein
MSCSDDPARMTSVSIGGLETRITRALRKHAPRKALSPARSWDKG